MKNPGSIGGPIYLPSTVTFYSRGCGGAENPGTWGAYKDGIPKETWVGGDTPNFRSLVRQGAILPHQFYRWTHEALTGLASNQSVVWDSCTLSPKQSFRHFGDWCQGPYGVGPIPPSTPVTNGANFEMLGQSAANRFMSKAQFDAGTFLAESKELRTLHRGIIDSFVGIAKNGVFKASNLEEYLNVWLSFRYGLRPLISDIQRFNRAAIEASKRHRKVFVKARAEDSEVISGYSTPQYFSDENQYWRLRWRFNGQVKYSFNIVGELNPIRVRFDPATTLWEVVPYSFVIDWFYTVGDWLDSVRLVESGLNHAASANTLLTYTATPEQDMFQYRNTCSGSLPRFFGTYSFTAKSRTPMAIPSDSPSLAGLSNLDGYKVVDGIALLLQPWLRAARKKWSYIPFNHPYDSTGLKLR